MAEPALALEALEAEVMKLPGWCTPEKFRRMHDLVVEAEAGTCVEIGVFGGRSLAALAAGCRTQGRGHAWGIDPYTQVASLANVAEKANVDYWGRIDYERTYIDCVRALRDLGLIPRWCTVLRTTDDMAAGLFGRIDVLHIDGNHAEQEAVRDVSVYVPKVRPGGYVVFDDTDWASTQKAVALLRQSAAPVGPTGAYGVFRRG